MRASYPQFGLSIFRCVPSYRQFGFSIFGCVVLCNGLQLYENGVAGIQITGSNNFTFDATIGEESLSGEGNVGTVDGQQPIEVIIEGSSLVTFNDLRVQSSNGER